MKIHNSIYYYWLVCSAICFFSFLTAALSNADEGLKQGVILVTEVQGGVLFSTPEQAEPKPLKKGDRLKQGATILTSKNSVADLAFSNGSVMQVAENSKFVIQEFSQSPWEMDKQTYDNLKSEPGTSQTIGYLDFGDIIADVKKLNKNSSLNVSTPLGTAGVRGTAFRLTARRGPDGRALQAQLSVARGQVEFASAGGTQVTVNGGFTSSIGAGSPQGDAASAPSNSAAGLDAQIVQIADVLRGIVDGPAAEALNADSARPISAEQQQAIEQASQQGDDALVETVSRLVTESPSQAVEIAEFAAEQSPAVAPRIAAAAAIVTPVTAVQIAAGVSSIIPSSAPEIAAAVALVVSNAAPQIAVGVSNVVPTLTAEIAASVVSSVPQSTLAVAQAVASAHPQQADRISDAISQTAGGLDSQAVKNAVQKGVQESMGVGDGTSGQTSPQPVINDGPDPIFPQVTPTPTPVPSGI